RRSRRRSSFGFFSTNYFQTIIRIVQQSLFQQSFFQQLLRQRSLSQEPFSLNVNLPSLQSDINNPPLIIDPTERDIIIRNQFYTPVMNAKSINTMLEIMLPTATQQNQ